MQRHPYLPCRLLTLICLGACASAPAQELDPDFKPELVAVEFTSRQVRPGDAVAMTIKFRNAGTQPAESNYRVFVHFEAPGQICENIVISDDHEPAEPTSLWQPGEVVLDGPRLLTIPEDKPQQEYFVHVGLFDHGGTGRRLLDSYAGGKLRVIRNAPLMESVAPKRLAGDEVQRRRQALADRIPPETRVSLQTPKWRFDVDRNSGAWALTDAATGVIWTSDPARPRFGQITLKSGNRSAVWRIDRFDQVTATRGALHLLTRPLVDGRPTDVKVTFTVEPVTDPDGLRLAYESTSDGQWSVTGVRLLESALAVTDADDGRFYVPHRLGIELPADEGLPGSRRWTTYNSLTMAMSGAVKQGSGLLVNWESVDSHLTVDTTWPDLPLVPGRRANALSLDIDASQGMCTIHPLGRGGYVEIARAYRLLAEAKGWLKTWAQKREQFPGVDRIFGAADFKPFVFSRVMPGSRFSHDGKERSHRSYTFDEAAACAEHWRNDLEIDRAFVVLAGWVNGGYDVRHPDILPAAPECGGDAELAEAARRIKQCGYLFGLHDNYQDMYEDAPSWGQQWLNKNSGGVAKMGGNWNGGQAWQVCAVKQVELAARQATNLPKIAELFGPEIYFIDTVFAWPLVTCEDPAHPMTRLDDLRWKTELCLLAQRHFGLFGSEEGREWAVPCSDYLEGIFGHQTDSPPGTVIPLLPLVYSDCVQIMTHQGNRIGPGDEKKVADHVLFAEMPLPSFGRHGYWTQPTVDSAEVLPLTPVVKHLGGRKFEITYRWKTEKPLADDYYIFAHFTHESADHPEDIAYQNDHLPKIPTSRWQPDSVVEDGPYTVEVPEKYSRADIRLGMTLNGQRVTLAGGTHQQFRYHVGTIVSGDDSIECREAPALKATELWTRGDGGWCEHLCRTDRVIKNTWEVLSPLNVITAESPLASHEFLTADRLLQRTRFGEVTITVAYDKPAEIGHNSVPAHGFIIQSPRFIAFCATRYAGIDYHQPTLFTARSLDGEPIADSRKVRIYHGFGDPRISLFGKQLEVQREQIVSMK